MAILVLTVSIVGPSFLGGGGIVIFGVVDFSSSGLTKGFEVNSVNSSED